MADELGSAGCSWHNLKKCKKRKEKLSGVARAVKLGGQTVGNAVFQVGKKLLIFKHDYNWILFTNSFNKSGDGVGGASSYSSGSALGANWRVLDCIHIIRQDTLEFMDERV